MKEGVTLAKELREILYYKVAPIRTLAHSATTSLAPLLKLALEIDAAGGQDERGLRKEGRDEKEGNHSDKSRDSSSKKWEHVIRKKSGNSPGKDLKEGVAQAAYTGGNN